MMFDKTMLVTLPFSLKREEIKEGLNTLITLDELQYQVKGVEFPVTSEDTLSTFTLYLVRI